MRPTKIQQQRNIKAMRIRYTMQLPTKKADTVIRIWKKINFTAKNHDYRWCFYIRTYSTLNSPRWNAEPEWTSKKNLKTYKAHNDRIKCHKLTITEYIN